MIRHRANHETVKLGFVALGVITWNDFLQHATFQSYRKELNHLERHGWECPVAARLAVQQAAREAGLG